MMPLHHTVVTGMTQLSGKTTTLEALIARSGLRAIAFKTKRGESGFNRYHETPAFFIEQSDWQYVSSILEATLRERMKFERAWIMRATKGTRTLNEVLENVIKLKARARKGSLHENVYTTLEAYLNIVIPQLERFEFSRELRLVDGINVMELTEMSVEMRSLVIRSTMEHVINEMKNVVVIVPEAWEYLPQGRSTPVKVYAETFIRKGASIGNYLFIDSQDIAGVDKTPLRQCNNWIMGRQREAHEVARVRELVGKKRLSAEEIRTLPLGHFIAAIGDELKRAYVLPADVPESVGRGVALGTVKVEFVKDLLEKGRDIREPERFEVPSPELAKNVRKGYEDQIRELRKHIRALERQNKAKEGELEELQQKIEDKLKRIEVMADQITELKKEREGFLELRRAMRKILGPAETKVVEKVEATGPSAEEVTAIVDTRLKQLLSEAPPARVVSIDLSERFREIIREDFVADLAGKIQALTSEPRKAAIIVRERKSMKMSELYFLIRGKPTGRIPGNFYASTRKLEDAHLVTQSKGTGVISWSLDEFIDGKLIDLYDEETRRQVKDYMTSLLLLSHPEVKK